MKADRNAIRRAVGEKRKLLDSMLRDAAKLNAKGMTEAQKAAVFDAMMARADDIWRGDTND